MGCRYQKWDVLAVLATTWRIHSWNLEFNNLDLTHTFFFQSWSATLENTLIKFGMNTKNTNPKKEGIRRKVAYNKQCNGEPQFLVSEPWEFLENAKVVFPDSVNPMTLYQSRIWTGEDHLQKIKPLKRLQAFGPFNKKTIFRAWLHVLKLDTSKLLYHHISSYNIWSSGNCWLESPICIIYHYIPSIYVYMYISFNMTLW